MIDIGKKNTFHVKGLLRKECLLLRLDSKVLLLNYSTKANLLFKLHDLPLKETFFCESCFLLSLPVFSISPTNIEVWGENSGQDKFALMSELLF